MHPLLTEADLKMLTISFDIYDWGSGADVEVWVLEKVSWMWRGNRGLGTWSKERSSKGK